MRNKNRALFLDRDGVINVDHGYVYQPENFDFIDGIFQLCQSANKNEYLIIIVTNQAGIGRGYYSKENFLDLTNWMNEKFISKSVSITDVFYCPFHPTHGIGSYKKESFDRKPNPGMLLHAQSKHNIDMSRSILIGDKDSDILAAKNAGVGLRCHYIPFTSNCIKSPSATHSITSLNDAKSFLVNE